MRWAALLQTHSVCWSAQCSGLRSAVGCADSGCALANLGCTLVAWWACASGCALADSGCALADSGSADHRGAGAAKCIGLLPCRLTQCVGLRSAVGCAVRQIIGGRVLRSASGCSLSDSRSVLVCAVRWAAQCGGLRRLGLRPCQLQLHPRLPGLHPHGLGWCIGLRPRKLGLCSRRLGQRSYGSGCALADLGCTFVVAVCAVQWAAQYGRS